MRLDRLRPLTPAFRSATSQQSRRCASWWRRRQAADDGQQRIRIQQPRFSFNRFFLLATYSAASYVLLKQLGAEFDKLGLDEWEPADDETAPQVDENGLLVDDDEDALFIPMQWPTRLPQTYYKQSDPDWQEFVKMSYDDQRKADVRDELALRIANNLGSDPHCKMRLGRQIEWTGHWLDFRYPDGPPPQYARKGIQIGEGYIAWTLQTIPNSVYQQYSAIFKPYAVFSAFKQSLYLFYVMRFARLKKRLGLTLSQTDKGALGISQMYTLAVSKAAAAAKEKRMSRSAPSPATDPLPPDASVASKLAVVARRRLPELVAPVSFSLLTTLRKSTIFIDLELAAGHFRKYVVPYFLYMREEPLPEGSFLVAGQVEIKGTVAKCKVDVEAAYDPRTGEFARITVNVGQYTDLQQRAKGGP